MLYPFFLTIRGFMTVSSIYSTVHPTEKSISAGVAVVPWTKKPGRRKAKLRVGVVGYSNQDFDSKAALSLIQRAFDDLDPAADIEVVSGLTDLGIPALAYEEAVRRGWKTTGIACAKAFDYPCFPVDDVIIQGDHWGDESPVFLRLIDLLIRIGGGTQSHFEACCAKMQGKQVMEFDLPALLPA